MQRNKPITSHFLLALSSTEILLGILASISIAVIFLPKDWVSHTLEFNPLEYSSTISDDTYSGGDSKAFWINEKKKRWQCNIGEKYSTPYCGMRINTRKDSKKGIYLRAFQKMTIWVSYKGNEEYVRLYLRNRHPNYYIDGNDTTTKYNMVEVPVKELETGLTLNLSDFNVADWWLRQKRIPLQHAHPEFNDVIYIELQTGSQVQSGSHQLELKRIRWKGSYISDENLYRGMVLTWSAIIFVLLLYRMLNLKNELSKTKRYQNELLSINKLLNLQNKQFEDLAKTDQLTGLLNRLGIRDSLYNGLRQWNEEKIAFSFVLVDIDHFKRINDTYGHDVGDEVLKSTAQLFSKNIRRTDYLARWGGEEFILLCPNTPLKDARIVAELLRQKLEQAELHPNVKVTASFGVSTLITPSLDQLFKAADTALYKAKNQGRNCVEA